MPTRIQIREAKERLSFIKSPSVGKSLPLVPRSPRVSLPCVHEGPVLEWCHTCGGHEGKHVRECDIFEKCTRLPNKAGVASCSTCGEYRATPPDGTSLSGNYNPVEKRHLLYHILPVSGNGVWRKGIDQLRFRWGLFTGRKVVCIATGERVRERVDRTEGVSLAPRVLPLDSPHRVREYLPPDCEVITVPNDPIRWELATWDAAWPLIFGGAGPDDAVFYAHTKGSTRKVESPCHTWADIMYRSLLDHWSVVERVLRTRPLAGSLVRYGAFFPPPNHTSRWHYAGNFWWARTAPLELRLGTHRGHLHNGHSSEAWLGTAFDQGDAGVVFTPRDEPGFLYSPTEITRVAAAYSEWLGTHPPEPVPPLSLKEGVPG